jgi:predicted membrane metal-binding protein
VYYNPQNNKELAVFYSGLDHFFYGYYYAGAILMRVCALCMTGADETCSFSVVTANFFRQSFIQNQISFV